MRRRSRSRSVIRAATNKTVGAMAETLERRVLLSGVGVQFSTPYPVQGAGEFEVDATLVDPSPVNTSTISPSNITVTGPNGSLAVLDDRVQAFAGGTTVSVAYIVQSPGGIWDSNANGNYLVSLQPNQIVDAAGASTASSSVSFTASLAPLTSLQAVGFLPSLDSTVTTAGTQSRQFEVTYSDPAGVNVSTINSSNVLGSSSGPNTRPNLLLTLQSYSVADGGTVVNAYYSATTQGGAFYEPDDGNYSIENNFQDPVLNNAGASFQDGPYLTLDVSIGSLDSSFATSSNGFVTTAIAHQSNGDIILAGYQEDTAGLDQMVVERLTPNGILDPTFGTNGVWTFTDPAGGADLVYAVAIESDDSIVLAGEYDFNGISAFPEYLLAHLTSQGQMDQSFGDNGTGLVTADPVEGADRLQHATAVAVAPDGTIIAGGNAEGWWGFVECSATGGNLQTFLVAPGPYGPNSSLDESVSHLAFRQDGAVIAVGSANGYVGLAEFDLNGQPAPGFNGPTSLIPEIPTAAETLSDLAVSYNQSDNSFGDPIGMAIDAAGNIIVANHTPTSTSDPTSDFAIERLNDDGVPDTTFGTNGTGVVTVDFGGDDDADSVAVQPGGQIVVTGTTTDPNGNTSTAVASLNADGTSNDTTFQNGEYVYNPDISVGGTAGVDTIHPDDNGIASGIEQVFGNADGDKVQVTTSLSTSTGGGTSTSQLNIPGIGRTLSAPALTTTGSTYSFSVDYTDSSELNASSLGNTTAVTVAEVPAANAAGSAAPAAATDLQVLSAVVNNGLDGSPRTVTYTVAAPDGAWTDADNGAYQVSVNQSVIKDDHANYAVSGTIGEFNVEIPPPGVSVSGIVFNDQNDNGVQDAGESGISGVVVYADVNGSGNPSGQMQAITNSAGAYTIGGLTSGQTYTIREVLPTGYGQTSPAADAGQQVSLTSAGATGVNFGEILGVAPGSLSGEVYNGLSGAPLAGVTVFLDSNRNGVLDTGELSSVTDNSGSYRFSDLAAGTYDVVEVLPSGQTTQSISQTLTVSSGATTGPSFSDVPIGVPAGTAAANLIGQFTSAPPASVVAGTKGRLSLEVKNSGSTTATGAITVSLFASTTSTLAGAMKIEDLPVKLNLKAGKSQKIKLNFNYPTGLPNGSYSMLASIDSGDAIVESSKLDNLVVSTPVTIDAPFITLAGALTPPGQVTAGKSTSLLLSLANDGNIAAQGTTDIQIFASSDQSLDSGDVDIETIAKHVNLKPGKSVSYRLPLKVPSSVPAGTYYLIAKTSTAGSVPAETFVAQSQTVIS